MQSLSNYKGRVYAGVDVGSVSVNVAALDEELNVVHKQYIRTAGAPIAAVKKGLAELSGKGLTISGIGTTGSGRHLAGLLIGADEIKNEITAHSVASMHYYPEASTVLEIGGQDSKIIIIHDRVVVDFAMNTICAAGTGSFLDQQAQRLGIDIRDFGALAAASSRPTKIAGRCGVFAESDMIHKQQIGYSKEDIIAGLCDALVQNYLNNVGHGKKIEKRIVFQGGVAANSGIVKSFMRALNAEITVPEHYDVMGAIGAAIITARSFRKNKSRITAFKGFECAEGAIESTVFECAACSNQCEIVSVKKDSRKLFNIGGRCGRYDAV
ncbi:MAG TPA: acyl-CoA dehydratase activase [Candidatus Wallbacteria bacterium]|nr:acyl-CoA dehydratase activase [Candidatus Wallbacteria bacterium]